MNKIYDIYVDGSFDSKSKITKWAFIVVDGEPVFGARGNLNDPIITEGYQIGGELQAVIEAVKWLKENDLKGNIYYDYSGIYNWIADIFGEKPWKANKEYVKKYREFILENKQYLNKFTWVEGHSGNTWNERVDKFAAGKVDIQNSFVVAPKNSVPEELTDYLADL